MSSWDSHFSLKRTGAPAFLPVSVDEVRDMRGLTHSLDDAKIKRAIERASETVEGRVRRAMATATWRMKLDYWPCVTDANPWGSIEVKRPPLQSVTSIAYLDADGVSQTWSSSNYIVDTDSEPGRISLAYGASWPTVRSVPLPITITYIAGYTSAELIPAVLHGPVAHLALHLLENPEPILTGTISSELPLHVQAMLDAASLGDLVCA